MMITNGSLTQSMRRFWTTIFLYGHVKFSFRILYHKHRPTPIPTMSSLVFYNHSISRLISFNVDRNPIFHTPPETGNICGDIHRCNKTAEAICACLIWHNLRLTWEGHFITTSFFFSPHHFETKEDINWKGPIGTVKWQSQKHLKMILEEKVGLLPNDCLICVLGPLEGTELLPWVPVVD